MKHAQKTGVLVIILFLQSCTFMSFKHEGTAPFYEGSGDMAFFTGKQVRVEGNFWGETEYPVAKDLAKQASQWFTSTTEGQDFDYQFIASIEHEERFSPAIFSVFISIPTLMLVPAVYPSYTNLGIAIKDRNQNLLYQDQLKYKNTAILTTNPLAIFFGPGEPKAYNKMLVKNLPILKYRLAKEIERQLTEYEKSGTVSGSNFAVLDRVKQETINIRQQNSHTPENYLEQQYMGALAQHMQQEAWYAALPYFTLIEELDLQQSPSFNFFWGKALVNTGQPVEGSVKLNLYMKEASTTPAYINEAKVLLARAKADVTARQGR